VPVGGGSGQTRDFEGKDGADPPVRNVLGQALEAAPPLRAGPALAKVLIDDVYAFGAPAQLLGPLLQRILTRRGLTMLVNLLDRRLPQVHGGLTIEMVALDLVAHRAPRRRADGVSFAAGTPTPRADRAASSPPAPTTRPAGLSRRLSVCSARNDGAGVVLARSSFSCRATSTAAASANSAWTPTRTSRPFTRGADHGAERSVHSQGSRRYPPSDGCSTTMDRRRPS